MWFDDLQLYLLSDSIHSGPLFDHTSGASLAPPATADSATRSQWLTRDATTCLAVCNHQPLAEHAHFGQHKTANALYDAVVTRYSSPATAAIGHLILPYLFPELSTFATLEDLLTHLHTSNARYRAALPAEFLDKNQPPMYITLYFIVTRLPDSLRAVRDHFFALDPTDLTVDLLDQHLIAAATSVVVVASAAAVDILGAEDVGAASALSGKRRSSKGKGGKSGGGGSGGGGGGGSRGGGGGGGGGSGGSGGGSEGFGGSGGGSGGGGGGSGGGNGSGGGGSGGGRGGAVQRGGSGDGQRQHKQCGARPLCPSSSVSGLLNVGRLGHRYFFRLDVAWGAEFGDEAERPHCSKLLRSGVAIFALDYDAILVAMYAFSVSAEGDCYLCVPPDPGIEAVALGASESPLPGTALAEALHTFTLDSGASRCFFHDSTTLTSLPAPVLVRMADPSRGPVLARSSTVLPCPASVSIYTCTQTGRHLATFTRRPGSGLYTLTTELPQVAAFAQVSASGPVSAPCSCRLLSHQTLLWHHQLSHPSLPRLRGMHSRLLRAAPHSSFPPTSAPLQTLYKDVWGPARVIGQDREHYFLLVVDEYTRYTTVFPLRSKSEVPDVLIPWIRAVRLQLRERFREDLPVLRLHSDRGVMEVARTSMIHAVAPHFLWPFAVLHAAHQLNRWPRVSLPETSPTSLRWTGKVGDASVFRVWGSRSFVHDTCADKLSSHAIPCDFLGSGSVSWRSTHSSSILSSSCEAEIYAVAMAAQELRWLTYLLIDLGERPRSSPVLYVDNKAMITLCQEHRLEHRTKHIALRYFLARELQQRSQLRLAYVATRTNTTDIFIKALHSGDHQRLCTVLGLVPTLPHLLTS
ncbi:unnamed protein product [Closterium sp. NIES-54]